MKKNRIINNLTWVLLLSYASNAIAKSSDAMLFEAVRSGDAAEVRQLLKDGTSPNVVDKVGKEGETPLIAAVKYAETDKKISTRMIKELRRNKKDPASPDMQDFTGMTPLHWAAVDGAYDTVRELVKKNRPIKANVDMRDTKDNTPLVRATMAAAGVEKDILNDYERVVKYLLKTGDADPNLRNRAGKSALFYAAKANSHEMVKRLLDHDATPTPAAIKAARTDKIKQMIAEKRDELIKSGKLPKMETPMRMRKPMPKKTWF